MAKKKKKKSDKTPYVHIDIMPEQEQFPDAQIKPGEADAPQGKPGNGAHPQQRINDPRRRGEGFNAFPSEVVSASKEGLSKKKVDGRTPVGAEGESDETPFVIPVFRKSDIPQPGQGMPPMQQRMYGTSQFPPVGGGIPNGNPRQNLTQIQQNLLNHHNAARQQAGQQPRGQRPAGPQMGQNVHPQGSPAMQQGGHPMAQQQMQQSAQQAAAKQGTGQFAPIANQAAAQQQAQAQARQAQQQAQAHQQAMGAQMGQTAAVQGTQHPQQGTMQAVANAAAARGAQSRAAAQAQRTPQQGMRPQAAQQMGAGIGVQQHPVASQASAFPAQRQGMPASGQGAAQARAAQGVGAAASQFQASQTPAANSKASTSSPSDSDAKGKDADKGKVGEPLLDPKAADESPMFDKPPVSIEEGMRKSTSGRKARRRAIVIIVLLVVLLGGGVAAYLILSEQGVVPRISIETATVQVTPQGSSSSTGAGGSSSSASAAATDPGTTPDTPSGGDLAGTVVYQYTANTASGVEYKVEETVTFQSNGDCQSSTMNMTFPDAASAKTFTDNLARDYGTSFKLDSLNGNNAVVTIDNSGLHLTRDEYENALRYSVSDLVVTK